MKKLMSLLLVLCILTVTVSGCGKKSENATATEETETETTETVEEAETDETDVEIDETETSLELEAEVVGVDETSEAVDNSEETETVVEVEEYTEEELDDTLMYIKEDVSVLEAAYNGSTETASLTAGRVVAVNGQTSNGWYHIVWCDTETSADCSGYVPEDSLTSDYVANDGSIDSTSAESAYLIYSEEEMYSHDGIDEMLVFKAMMEMNSEAYDMMFGE